MEKIHDLHSFEKTLRTPVSFRTKTARSLLFSHRRVITPYRARNLWRTPSTVPSLRCWRLFTSRKSLSEKDIAEIQRMIDRCGKE